MVLFFRARFGYQVVERRDFNPVAKTLTFSFNHTPAIYLEIVIWLLRLSELVQHDGCHSGADLNVLTGHQ